MHSDTNNTGPTKYELELFNEEPEFDMEKLKVELNNITIMHGPPHVTLGQAERAMMAYINTLLEVST